MNHQNDAASPDQSSTHAPSRSCGSGRARCLRRTGLALCLMIAVGMLIWFKLRVVTGVPRQAYADPETAQKDRPANGAGEGKAPTGQPRPPQPGR